MSTSNAAAAAASGAPQCSICLDPVTTRSQRSTARLFCGHFFHLDCIGSEFNFKRSMRCPNCRLVEEGNWRFAAGGFQQAITNDDYQEPENNNDIDENDIVDDFLRVASLGMQPTTISIVRYNMVNEFHARPMFRTLQPQPMPPSVQPAPVPRVQIQQAVWGSVPRTAATTSATPQLAQRRSRGVGPNRASPARNQGPAPRGQVVRPSSQGHQPRLPRNRGAAAPAGTGPVNDHQRRQPSNRAGAVRGSPSQISHRDVGTSMPQPSTPSSSSQGSAGQLPRRQNSMGYFMSMLTEDSDDEDDLPVYQFL